MSNDLSQLMGLADVQSQYQKRYSDALREKRQYEQIAGQAGERFSQALSSENPVALNPADVFNAYSSFDASMGNRLVAPDDLLAQIANIASVREQSSGGIDGSGVSESDLLKLRQQRIDQDLDTSDIDELLGIKKAVGENEVQAVKLIDEILSLRTAGATGLIRAGIIKPYETEEARQKLKQINNILQMAKAGELKGQGQISDGERQILADAASSLGITSKGTTKLKDETLRRELKKIQSILAKQSNDPSLIQAYTGQEQTGFGFNADKLLDDLGIL